MDPAAPSVPPIDWLELRSGIDVERSIEHFDEPTEFRTVVTYKLRDGRVYQHTAAKIAKINPFVADRGVIDIDLGDGAGFQQRHESTLAKSTGVVDNANEYSAWVECRLPGTDQVVHRSASTWLKKTPDIGTQMGRF